MKKSGNLVRFALLALILALSAPTAMAGKGGDKGKPGGGGGGDPAPTCSGHVYTLWETFDGRGGPRGIARVCLDGADGEQLSTESLGWYGPIELSPDSTQLVNKHGASQLVYLSDPETVLQLSTDLPRGTSPSWSWRVDGSGEPLAAANQYLAVSQDQQIEIVDYGTTHATYEVVAFHPTVGAQEFDLTSLPRSYTRVPATVTNGDTGEEVDGAIVNIVWTVVGEVTWVGGSAANPDISWIIFHQTTTDETWDAVGDASDYQAWSTDQYVEESWQVLTVVTSSTGVTAVGTPQPLIAAADLSSVDVRAGTQNMRFSKYGTHALWEHTEEAGMRRAALRYSSTDIYATPQIDVTTITDIDAALYDEDNGPVQFGNVAISHDGSRIAHARIELVIMDIDAGASSLTQISETVRRNKPGYVVPTFER